MEFRILKVQTMGNKEVLGKLIKHFTKEEIEFAIIGDNFYANSSMHLDDSEGSEFECYGTLSHIMKLDTEQPNNGCFWDFIHEQKAYIKDFYTLVDVISFEKNDGDMVFYRRISKAPKDVKSVTEVK